MVCTLSGKPICALFCLFEVSPALPLKRFQNWSDWWWPFWADPFEARSRTDSSFLASLLMATDGVMSMALCQQVVPQTAEHFSLWTTRKLLSLAAFLDVFSSGLQWGVYTVRFIARINVWPTAIQYTPNSTAARRNWRRQLHSSCRQDSQCSGDWEEEEVRGDPWLGVHSQGNMNGGSSEKNRS